MRYVSRDWAKGSSAVEVVEVEALGWEDAKEEDARRRERTILASRARGARIGDEVEAERTSSWEEMTGRRGVL